jgi:hypothetical protein
MKALDKKQILIDASVILIAFLVFAFFAYYPDRNVRKNHKYSVATVTAIEGTLNGAPDAILTFNVGGRNYNGNMSSYKGENISYKKGDKLFVMFYPLDPSEFLAITDKDVPDKLTEIPSMGWDTIPY